MDQPKKDRQAIIQELEKFKKDLSRLNMIEVGTAFVVIPIFLWFAFSAKVSEVLLLQIGTFTVVGGGVYHLWFLVKKKMRRWAIPSEEGSLEYFRYWQGWYKNVYGLARGVFWWGLLPFMPGVIIMVIGFYQVRPEGITRLILFMLVVGGVWWWWYRYYLGRKYKTGLDKVTHVISELESDA